MSSIAENITRLMELEGINASELSRLTGIDRSVLHKILTGATKNPSIESIKAIIQHYNFSEVVLGHKEIRNEENRIPIISWSEATLFPSLGPDTPSRQYLSMGFNVSKLSYCLMIDFDLDSRFRKGTLLVVDTQKEYKNSSFVIIQQHLDSCSSLKRYVLDGNTPYLKSIDPTLPSTKYEPNSHKILGVVIQAIFDLE